MPMLNFRRVKIQATVETPSLLIPEDEIEGAVGELRERLQDLHLSIVSLESTEPPAPVLPEGAADDPWWGV